MAKVDTYYSSKSLPAFAVTEMTGTQSNLFGAIIDTYKTESVTLIGHIDQLSSGTISVTLLESDDPAFTVSNAVPAEYWLGGDMLFTSSDPDGVLHKGYVGKKRYIRTVSSFSSAAAGSRLGVTALLSYPYSAPLQGNNPPVA